MELKRFEPDEPRPAFSCGDADLDEFFSVDSKDYARELLAVTYALMETNQVLAYFSVSNDAIKKEDCPRSAFTRIMKVIPHKKRYSSMPAAKIGRIGVRKDLRRSGIGTKILDFLKASFTIGNKTGCRFLIVDAYNDEETRSFYLKNGFLFLTSKDEKEETRIMFFDLKTFRV